MNSRRTCTSSELQVLFSLRLQIETSKVGRGGRRYLPHVFTEHGVAMLSAILNSERAIMISIYIIQAFVKMRERLSLEVNNETRIIKLEIRQDRQGRAIEEILKLLEKLADEPIQPSGPIGFM